MTHPDRDNSADRIIATAKPAQGVIEASGLFAAAPMRVFQALTSSDICDWWIRPGVFNTTEWQADLREGGRWSAAGIGGGQPYRLEGEFVEIEVPVRLVMSWKPAGAAAAPSLLSYRLHPLAGGVQLRLHHSGFADPEICERTRAGWESSLIRLQDILRNETAQAGR